MPRTSASVLLKGEQLLEPEFPIFANRIEESFSLRKHYHDFVEINYVAEGKGFHYINRELIPSGKGDLFIIPLGTSHVFRPSSASKTIIVYNCLFKFEFVKDWSNALQLSQELLQMLNPEIQGAWYRFYDYTGDFNKIFSSLNIEFLNRSIAYKPIVLGKLTELLGRIVRLQKTSNDPIRQRTHFIDQVKEYISFYYADRINAQDIATYLGMSTSHFHRLFKKFFGITFNTYLQNFRIEKSCQLLRDTDYKLQHIIELVGYKDVKFFHKLFKEKTGSTPHQYRLKHRR